MKHLTKEELEKLKVGDELEVSCFTNPFNNEITLETNTQIYTIQVERVRWGRNGYRIKTKLIKAPDKDLMFPEIDTLKQVRLNFTINGAFTNYGIHNPGPNYLRRKYYKV